jgi:lauroyl/myristoyl acyltransferase
MAKFYVDTIDIWKQKLLPVLPYIIDYSTARRLLLAVSAATDSRDAYLAAMRLEVVWLSERYLKSRFKHFGVEHINPDETYVITSLHFGQWGMYPASLNQQYGISSQMVMTGRNNAPGSPLAYFWGRFGHQKQILSGYPGCYSTDGFYSHARQLNSGISQIVIMDVREFGLRQKELALHFMGGPYYLPKTVALLARKAKIKILPYIGYYDVDKKQHQVYWFEPIQPGKSDQETLQQVLNQLEPVFSKWPDYYFNVLQSHRQPY